MGNQMRHAAQISFRCLGNFVEGGLHGHHHVGTGIAVRNGEDIQGIHRLMIGAQPEQTGFDQIF